MIISIFKPISTKFLFTKKKIATVSVINDLVSDVRVRKSCEALVEMGYDVLLVGRRLPSSPELPQYNYRCIRMRLIFTKGPLFYMFFNLRLFLLLLFKSSDLYFANDLDTLLPNYLLAKLKKKPLIYDSHEIFCEVPELQRTPLKKKIWQKLEKTIVPKIKYCITVNNSIAGYFQKLYGTKFIAVRNIPPTPSITLFKSRIELGLPSDKKIILLQGAGINIDRGAEELVEAMQYLDNALLLIIGSGDVWQRLEKRAAQLPEKIMLIKRLPKDELLHYTHNADIGISIDKNNNLNYRYSLPNKLFDYLQMGLPVLSSNLPEIAAIISNYNAGEFITGYEPKVLAENIQKMLNSTSLPLYRRNALAAAAELTWDKEKQQLLNLIEQAGA